MLTDTLRPFLQTKLCVQNFMERIIIGNITSLADLCAHNLLKLSLIFLEPAKRSTSSRFVLELKRIGTKFGDTLSIDQKLLAVVQGVTETYIIDNVCMDASVRVRKR